MVDFGGVALKAVNRSSKKSVSRKKFKGWVAIKEGKRGRFMYFLFLFCVAPFVDSGSAPTRFERFKRWIVILGGYGQ